MATGTTRERLEAAQARELERAKRLWLHLNGGEPLPDDEALLASLGELEEKALRAGNPTAGADGIELSPALAAILEQMAASQRANTEAILELAKGMQPAAPASRESGLNGSVADLAAALDGTTSDGGDGEDPLDTAVVFRSKGREFRCIIVPRRRYTGPTGEQYFTNGITLDFAPNGEYVTRNRRNVELLRARPGMNREYWLVGEEPHKAPDPDRVIEAIIEATLNLDDETLGRIEQDELAGHKRESVLQHVRKARLKVQGFAAHERGGEEG